MKVMIADIKDKMHTVFAARGYTKLKFHFNDVYLGDELRRHVRHELAGFSRFAKGDRRGLPRAQTIKETTACFYVDAKSNLGTLVGKRVVGEAITSLSASAGTARTAGVSSDILVCDNDNVTVDGEGVGVVQGTQRFMAPEVGDERNS